MSPMMILSRLPSLALNCERFLNRQRFSKMASTSLILSGFSTSFYSISWVYWPNDDVNPWMMFTL